MAERALADEPPLGVAITGHGAEYCIQLGGAWVSTDERLPPPGEVFPPARLRSPAVFLNGCASLRLGDSIVPARYSLSRELYRRGASVVGTFRNVHSSPDAGVVFAEGLLNGLPMGRIANRVNLSTAIWGDSRPAFQLLGDPCRVLTPRPDQSTTFVVKPRGAGLGSLLHRLADLDRVYATLSRWHRFPGGVGAAHAEFAETLRLALLAEQAAAVCPLDDASRRALVTAATHELVRFRALLLDELVGYVTANWFDALYAPLCHRVDLDDCACPRCGERVVRSRYDPVGDHLLSVERDECDRCGTVAERLGCESSLSVDAELVEAELRVRVGGSRPESIARVVIRKDPGAAPRELGPEDRTVVFPAGDLTRRGRVTVAAIEVDPGIAIAYHTLFLPLET